MPNVSILTPTSFQLPDSWGIQREPSREAQFIDESYLTEFDSTTLFYDAFCASNRLTVIAPPLQNLRPIIESARVSVDGDPCDGRINILDLDRTALCTLNLPALASSSTVEIHISHNGHSESIVVPQFDTSAYSGSRLLMTHQKNNDLQWIQDWATFYARNHGTDTLALYDNNSDFYSIDDIKSVLETCTELKTVVIIPWDFAFGPQGHPWVKDAPWDSDFCQISAFQDARYRFALESIGMINADIDELMVSRSNRTVYEAAIDSPNGVICVEGEAILGNTSLEAADQENPRHLDFWYKPQTSEFGGRKWVGVPSRWDDRQSMTHHWVRTIDYKKTDEFFLGHFRRINTGWKIPERTVSSGNTDNLRPDLGLLASLSNAFPERMNRKELVHALFEAQRNIDIQEKKLRSSDDPGDLAVLQSFITNLTAGKVNWDSTWIWQAKTLVFEVAHPTFGKVAIDVAVSAHESKISAIGRNQQQRVALKEKLIQLPGASVADKKTQRIGIRTFPSGRADRKQLPQLANDIAAELVTVTQHLIDTSASKPRRKWFSRSTG